MPLHAPHWSPTIEETATGVLSERIDRSPVGRMIWLNLAIVEEIALKGLPSLFIRTFRVAQIGHGIVLEAGITVNYDG